MLNVKFPIAGLFGFGRNVLLNAGRNISRAHLLFLCLCLLRMFFGFRFLFFRVFRVLLCPNAQAGHQEKSDGRCNSKTHKHMITPFRWFVMVNV